MKTLNYMIIVLSIDSRISLTFLHLGDDDVIIKIL